MRHWTVVVVGCGIGVALACAAPRAAAQAELERFERQLEQIQRDTRLRVDQRIPADQRTLFDYGGYLSLQYLSLDDQNAANLALGNGRAFRAARHQGGNVDDRQARG